MSRHNYDSRDGGPKVPDRDRDGDSIIDAEDACPDRPGAPDPNPKKNGCPGLVVIRQGQIVILKSVFFANDSDVILKNSFPVMQAVANVLLTQPAITKVAVEGHTDDRGDTAHNVDLSDRRAKSSMRWLIEHSIAESRLTAKGYGPQRPIGDNKTLYGRAKNRRVEFHILEPASLALPGSRPPAAAAGPGANAPEPPPAASPADGPLQLPVTPAGGPAAISAPVVVDAPPPEGPGNKEDKKGNRGKKQRGKKVKAVKGAAATPAAEGAAAAPAAEGAASPGDEKPSKKKRRAHKPK